MQRQWRLVNQTELYNLETDPSQQHNIARDFPELVRTLCQAYEDWWDLVSTQFALDTHFVLDDAALTARGGGGNDDGNENDDNDNDDDDDGILLTLSTHDIRNDAGDTAWHQSHVRNGYAVAGYWPLEIRSSSSSETALYSIELRRWPKSTDYKLTDGIDGDDSGWRKDCIQKKYAHLYEGGKALDLKWAHVEIAGRSFYRQIMDPDATSVVLENVELPPGKTRLFAGFYEKRPFGDNQTIAPYYIYIRKMKRRRGGR